MTQRVEGIAEEWDRVQESGSKRKQQTESSSKDTRKKARPSPAETVLSLIMRSRKGIDIATLRKKTGIEGRKMNAIIRGLKRNGKIRSVGRGIYLKA